MKPLKRKQISEIIAEKMKLPLDLVDEIVSSYYKQIQKKLSGLEHERLFIDGLGTFYIKKKKLDSKMQAYKNIIDLHANNENPDMSEFSYILALKTELKKFESIKEQINLEEQKKEIKKEEKLNYKKNKS